GQVSHVTRYDSAGTGQCEVTLRGGLKATVSAQNGHLTARPTDPAAAKGGIVSFNIAGHPYLMTKSAMRDVTSGTVDLSAYDTTRLAESACGIPAPSPSGAVPDAAGGAGTGGAAADGTNAGHTAGASLPGRYKLDRVTVRTIDQSGKPHW